MNKASIPCLIASLAFLLTAAARAQPVPSDGTTLPLQSGQSLFFDTDRYVFDDVPASIAGKPFLQVSFADGADFAVSGTGYVYVITPANGVPSSQAGRLIEQGFRETPFFYTQNIWTAPPPGYKLQCFEKKVQDGEQITFGHWGVVFFSGQRIKFETASVKTGAATDFAAVIPAARDDAWWVQRHEQKLVEARGGECDLVLLGDSITQRWETDGRDAFAKIAAQYRTLNLGFSGDRTQHVIWRLENGEIDGLHPKWLVLLIGTNNLPPGRSTPEETVEGIREIVHIVRKKLPDTTLLICNVFPRGQSSGDPIRQAVASTNAGIAAIADEFHLTRLDMGTLFLDPETGAIKENLMPDFLHPDAAGYEMWADLLLERLNVTPEQHS